MMSKYVRIKFHYAIILIALLSQFVFATVNSLSVSPYIKPGFAMSYSMRAGSMREYTRDTHPSNGSIVNEQTYDDDFRFLDLNFSFGIRERVDISFFTLPPILFPGEMRVNVNLFDTEKENALFKNIGMSVFCGLEALLLFFDYGYNNAYFGVSVGTKKIFNPSSSMELWTSPMVVAFSAISGNSESSSPTITSFSIPIAARFFFGEKTKISIKAGIDVMIPLSNSEEYSYISHSNVNRFVEKEFFPIAAAFELGVHFRSRKERKAAKLMKQETNI